MRFLPRPFLFFLFLSTLLGSCSASPSGGCEGTGVSTRSQLLGTQAPNFVLPNLAGEKVELATVANQKPTLLVFWATWCPSCIEEIPALNDWNEKYPGLQILGINVQEPAERVRTFVKKRKIRYRVLLDENGEVAEQYGLVGVPSTILLAKGGQVIYYGFALPRNIEQLMT